MKNKPFSPHHINATVKDLSGNGEIGRYVLLPGSSGRAKSAAEHLNNVTVKSHGRGHHLYLGSLSHQNKNIDIAITHSGMGCPSMEIILHELYQLGAKRFLRIGTAGSLQPSFISVGDFVNATAAVRDEDTTSRYFPIEVPALASLEMIDAIEKAVSISKLRKKVLSGTVHCKSAFYAREFQAGPKSQENLDYMNLLTQCGVLATEMETAALFVQTQLYDYQRKMQGSGPCYRVLSGAILGILAAPPHELPAPEEEQRIANDLITLGLMSIKCLADTEIP